MKPDRASGYDAADTAQAHAACLTLATILGDLLDELVIVGGLAPSLLVDQQADGAERHVGTMDLDVVLSVALLDDERYLEIAKQLRRHGFEPDKNQRTGNPTPQRWRHPNMRITIDFLIGAREVDAEPGRVKHLDDGFGAFAIEGVELAFADREDVTIDGATIDQAKASRAVGVCGPGAFVVLKARAIRLRGAGKDAYDLVYVLRNWPDGVADIAARINRLRRADQNGVVDEAIVWLREDFAAEDAVAPSRAAGFDDDADGDLLAAQAFAYAQELVRALDALEADAGPE